MKVYRAYEINEEHEIDLFFRAFECTTCGGHGKTVAHPWQNRELDGEDCSNCGGHGILFLRDCRPCTSCGKKIYLEQQGQNWIPMDANTDEQHRCELRSS